MFIVHGAYHWWPKRVAFRNDYCLACRAERRSVCTRTFDVGHIFWVPILPVGFWKHWFCSACGRGPHISTKLGGISLWLFLAAIAFFTLASWMAPLTPDMAIGTWVFRFGGIAVAVMLLVHLLRPDKGPSLKERLATVQPATDTICPFCETPLVGGTQWSCPACGVVRC